MSRGPTIFLLVLVVAGLLFADRVRSDATPVDVANPDSVAATSQSNNATGSTWYCPAGLTTPDASTDHLVTITNNTDRALTGSLTAFPSLFDTLGESVTFDRAVQTVSVEPQAQVTLSASAIVALLDPTLNGDTGAFVGALVEFDAEGIEVAHTLVSPLGTDTGPCATTADSGWWFASGTTTVGVRHLLFLLNPFPDDAVVDVTFVTDEGARSPGSFAGRLLPARTLTVLDVSATVSIWEQVAATVTTRSGRVVAERVQFFADDAGPYGVSMALGANDLGEQWFFPLGGAVSGAGESYVIFNPGDDPAEVEFQANLDSLDRAGDVAPVSLDIGPRERWIVNLSTHENHPVESLAAVDATDLLAPGDRFSVTVRSFNDVPIAVERLTTISPVIGAGVTTTLGIQQGSTDQLIALPPAGSGEARSGSLGILNPSGDSISRVQIFVPGESGETLREEVELAPRRRAVFPLDSLSLGQAGWIRITSTVGTMAELVTLENAGLSSTVSVPVAETLSVPDLLSFD